MANNKNPLRELEALGQSIWLDSIRRGQILSGELKKLRDEDGLSGETANPTIFEKAIAGSSDYDETIRKMIGEGRTPLQIYERIAVQDVQMACDIFRPIYDRTNGADGFVSIEVSPRWAYDTRATIDEAKRFFREVNRPNVMVKIPGTPQGLPAIEECLYSGVNINITLLFAVRAYEEVAWAYIHALERRLDEGKSIDHIASVASFFVSRIDTLADKMIDDKLKATQDPQLTSKLQSLQGKVAIANAKMAYERFKAIFGDARYITLREKAGARVQRPLWASTSTKNPHYPDVLYVEALIGPDTVNTLPLETIEAYRDHGHPQVTITQDLDSARRTLQTLQEVGLSLDQITDQVLSEGVVKFEDSLNQLLKVIEGKQQAIAAEHKKMWHAALDVYEDEVNQALDRADQNHMAERIWQKDVSVWKQSQEHTAEIRDRLGWLNVATLMHQQIEPLKQFAQEVRDAKFTSVVLCGMGGSSLCVEVFNQVLGSAQGFPKLYVLDTTDPATIQHLEKQIDVANTLFVIASKSGGTIETLDHYRYFFDRVSGIKGDRAGENFVAITDAGSGLEKTAQEKKFRRIFQNPSDIGGRYSALSYFGLVPAALMGIDLERVLSGAEKMIGACGANVPSRENPGVWLGVILGTLGNAGRDKVTIVTSPGLESFGLWAEQLIAESTGKQGKGLVPVAGEPLGMPNVYGNDRVFVYLRLDDTLDKPVDALANSGQPVVYLDLGDKQDIGAEFFRWEMATAVAGALLEIDPFDQPNVQESKDNTKRVLQLYTANKSLQAPPPSWEGKTVSVTWAQQFDGADDLRENIAAFVKLAKPGDYVALMAYVEQDAETDQAFTSVRVAVRDALKIATTLGYGPRFLHSTGQLHKGGPNNILAIQITADDTVDLPVPGEPYTFSTLKRAQALGDWQSLVEHGRRGLQIHLKRGAKIAELVAAFQGAVAPEHGNGKRPHPTPRRTAAKRAPARDGAPRKSSARGKRPAIRAKGTRGKTTRTQPKASARRARVTAARRTTRRK